MVRKADKICREARINAEKWFSYWHQNIENYHEMTRFILGEQWTEDEEDMLKTYKKVPLQVNKLGVLSNTLCGEQQQNTPQLQVLPMEDCDEETASIRELLVKDIMSSGNAKECYQDVASQAFNGGFSAYTVLKQYEGEGSFDQSIYYRWSKDPTRYYFDISAEDKNKTDGMFSGWLTYMSRAKFADTYGKNIEEKILPDQGLLAATKEEVAGVTSVGSSESMTWADENNVTIQNHFTKKSTIEMLYKLSNGHILNQEEMDDLVEYSKKRRNDEIMQMRMARLLQMQQSAQSQQVSVSQMQDPNMPDGQYDPLLGQQSPMPSQPISPDTVDDLPPDDLENEPLSLYDGDELVRIEDKKEVRTYKVKHQVICGSYILDESDMDISQLPNIFIAQRSYYTKDGKEICTSFFQDAKDTQRYINYLATQSAYVLKVSRYDQWIGSKKNVASQDTQQRWKDPITMQGMLTYDESPSGVVPQRIEPPELSQSLLTQYQRAIEDLYTSTGLYPTRMGQEGNEVSGAAIDARTRQGSYSTFVAFNALNRAIAKGGEIVNELIPSVYDTTRVVNLMTPDEGFKNIVLNQQMDEYGEVIKNDIRKGTYQVRLIPGPSYEGQKEQALQSLNAAITAYPPVFPMIADLYAENLPLANTIELKNRLRTLVPPNIIEAGKSGKNASQQPQQPNPEQMQQQMQAQFQQAQLQLKQQEIAIKQQELQLKAQKQTQDVQLELKKLESEQAQVAGELEKQKLEFMAETNRSQQDVAIAHANNMAKILTHSPFKSGGNNSGE